tara:strand:+ start:26 stop:283 length:258 start_codon:yes stop_codon:yes gene_type:complete
MNDVKLDKSLTELAKIKKWLNAHCGKRWNARNYKGEEIDWRKIHNLRESQNLYDNLPTTTYISFNKREDMLEFLQKWPSEVLINS